MTDAIGCVDSAVKLQLKVLDRHPMRFIKEHYVVLERFDHRLPTIHLIVIVKVHCKEVVIVLVALWLSALRPLKKLEDTKFFIDAPCYADTSALRMSPKTAEYKMFVDSWLASALPNPFWKLLVEMADDERRKQFVEMSAMFLDMMDSVDFSDLDADDKEEKVAPFKSVQRAYKGLLALASPVPGLGQLSDVEYVMPSNATEAPINREIPRYGRSLVSALRKDVGGFWKGSLREFQATIGCVEQCLPTFKAFEKDIQEFVKKLPATIEESFVDGFDSLAARCPAVARLPSETRVET